MTDHHHAVILLAPQLIIKLSLIWFVFVFHDLDSERKLADVIMDEIDNQQSRDYLEKYGEWLRKQGD